MSRYRFTVAIVDRETGDVVEHVGLWNEKIDADEDLALYADYLAETERYGVVTPILCAGGPGRRCALEILVDRDAAEPAF